VEPFAVSPIERLIAAVIASTISLIALRRSQLDRGGAIAAAVLGPAIVVTGGWWLGALLIAFFISSALLPNTSPTTPSRTWQQVLANGGPALALATASLAGTRSPLLIGAAAAIAATTADTWATEIGGRYGGTPYALRTGRKVPPGTSGAVTIVGTLASVGGGVMIGAFALLLSGLAPVSDLVSVGDASLIAACGAIGSAIDSALGASIQASFACTVCGHRSESPTPHQPGHAMRPVRGVPWMTNSAVNLLAASAAGLIAAVVSLL
jgi:uncharacterized protein (TIGR00297 family)